MDFFDEIVILMYSTILDIINKNIIMKLSLTTCVSFNIKIYKSFFFYLETKSVFEFQTMHKAFLL